MAGTKEAGGRWVSVPAFGDWDSKDGSLPDYSTDFGKIREVRRQTKSDVSRLSAGNEDDLSPRQPHQRGDVDRTDSRRPLRRASTMKSRISLFNCCKGDD